MITECKAQQRQPSVEYLSHKAELTQFKIYTDDVTIT